mmetsp:Transcript_8646/g.28319  ORF Transcript_8646/g.28319 Transcript_8646/m.28319 type:complete len:307 (+) Transcript_8646:2-922(+)
MTLTRISFVVLFVAPVVWCFGGPPKPRVVVSGGSTEVNLCCAKLAAKAGCEAYTIVQSQSDRDLWKANALMYGREYADQGSKAGAATAISGVDAIAKALSRAEAVIFCCDATSGPPTDSGMRAVFGNAPKLKHVAFLSTLGGGRAPFPGKSLDKAERTLRDLAVANNVEVSVVRVGNLKGGGPGEVDTTGPKAGTAKTDFGLAKYYYDTLVDLSQATATMAYDRFAVGADVQQGDPLTMPNPIVSAFTAGSFDPVPTDCSRLSAAAALVAAVRRPKGNEFTISAKADTQPPSPDQWIKILDQAAAM